MITTETVKSLDPMLALADLPRSRNFTRSINKQKVTGRLIPQRINQDNTHHHHDVFYVEFPLDSGNIYQVSIGKIAATLGDHKHNTRFNTATALTTLERIPNAYDFIKLLKITTV